MKISTLGTKKTTTIVEYLLYSHPPCGVIRDEIHQIVSRFLEQFRYMCPLLFLCFPELEGI
jgi:hypothetical protein